MIHVFGNSHAAVFTGAPPCGNMVPKISFRDNMVYTDPHPELPFRTWFLGPITAYNFNEKYLPEMIAGIQSKKSWFPEGRKIMLVVGEVDCRIHLPKQSRIQKNRSKESLTNEAVDRFFEAGIRLKGLGLEPMFFGTHPCIPTRNETMHKEEELGYLVDDDHWGTWGTDAERKDFCVLWDKRLEYKCNQHGFKFLSIYKHLVDENNKTKQEYYADVVHLDHSKCIHLILEEFKLAGICLD